MQKYSLMTLIKELSQSMTLFPKPIEMKGCTWLIIGEQKEKQLHEDAIGIR
jgi:hypothetical protein